MALKIGKDEAELRRGVVAACRSLSDLGLNRGTSGNVSVRHGKKMLISPTGIPYDELKPADVVRMSLDSTDYVWDGKLNRDAESLLVIKTAPDRREALTAALLRIHPYEVPEVVVLDVAAGNPRYLEWVGAMTRPQA